MDFRFARFVRSLSGTPGSTDADFPNRDRVPNVTEGGGSRCKAGTKLLSVFMSFVLAVSLSPAVSFAETEGGDGETGDSTTENVQGTDTAADAAPADDVTAESEADSADSAPSADAETTANLAPSSDNADVSSVSPESESDGANSSGSVARESSSPEKNLSAQEDESEIEIYSAALTVNGTTNYNVAVGDTLGVLVKDTSRDEISSDKLTYQWSSHDKKTGDFTPIEGATGSTYVVPAELEGKFIKCTVSVGSSSKTTRVSNKIAKQGSFYVSKVNVLADGKEVSSGDKIEAGTVLSATASDSSGSDCSDRATWKWYASSSSSKYSVSDSDAVSGATSSTFTVPSDSSYLGKYIFAGADGGFGEEKTLVGQVGVAGAVDLYKVEASAPSSAVHVGDVLSAKAYKKSSSSSYYSSSTPVSASDKVYYQWQYAKTKSTYDSSFTDIPGATGATYTVTDALSDGTSLVGCYLRVKATSNNSVVSTSTPSYYGSSSVYPLGPVSQAGQYTLDSVEVESSTQAMQVGATLTPTAKVKTGTYSSGPAPSDAKLTYTWYKASSASAAASDWTPIESGYDRSTGVITLDETLKGSYLKVKASALDNEVSNQAHLVMGAGEYELLRITVSPSSGDLFTGGTLTASVQAKRVTNSSYGDDVTGKVAIRWYLADSETADESSWKPIEGATSAELSIPDDAAGKYLVAKATSGNSSVSYVDKRAVVDSDSLDAAVKQLNASYFKFMPQYGVDTNANDYVKAALAKLGYDDVTVTTVSASMPNAEGRATATGGVSSAAADNGAITYFFEDPSTKTDYKSYTTIRNLDITFKLERGEESVAFTPSSGRLAWDVAKVKDWVSGRADQIAVGYASGDSAESVTGNLSLPYQLKTNASSWNAPTLGVSWTSSNEDALTISGSGYWSNYTGKVTRGSADHSVTLTATLDASNIDTTDDGLKDCACTVSYDVIVKGDPEKVAAEKKQLEENLDVAFTKDKLTYSVSGEKVGDGALSADVQLPRPKAINVDGGKYRVTYTASNDKVVVNGYRANVYLLQPGETDNAVDITCTVTSKENPEITASKTLSFTVAQLDQSDIDRESALMDAAVAGYWDAISNGQSASNVSDSLHVFKKATYAEDGTLVWSYDVSSADAAGSGIVPAELPGYDPMGSQAWRTFRSSKESVIQSENLVLNERPAYNTEVTVDSVLQSEKYARYAERYPDNATFAKLAGTPVSATFTVTGTTGQDPATVSATAAIVGIDADGNAQTWASAEPYDVKFGSTVEDLTAAMLKKAKLSADYGSGDGFSLSAVTSPDGHKVANDSKSGKSWKLYINGKAASSTADALKVHDGDNVVWAYTASDDPAPSAEFSVTCAIYGPDSTGASVPWATQATFQVKEGATAADITRQIIAQSGLEAEIDNDEHGFYLSTIASPFTGEKLGWNVSTRYFWQLFANGKSSTVGADQLQLEPGDSIVWSYSTDGEQEPVIKPDVNEGDVPSGYTSEWPGFAKDSKNGAVVIGSKTPAGTAKEGWAFDPFKGNRTTEGYDSRGVSDPLIVNGDIYFIGGGKIFKLNAENGKVKVSGSTGFPAEYYFSRPVYDSGMIIAAADDGRVAAFAADTLKLVWCTDKLPEPGDGQSYQNLSTITVASGKVYAAFTVVGKGNVGKVGSMVCVDERSGNVLWTTTDVAEDDGAAAGYYWSGACASGSDLVIADETGSVKLIDGNTGAVKAQLPIGSASHSGVIALDDVDKDGNGTYLAVSREDGTLHKIVRNGDALAEQGSVSFADKSTSTPSVANGKAFICGNDADNYGTLSVVDLATMKVQKTVRGGKGAAQSTPLVSVQGGSTYVYFTCNNKPGGVYLYKLGDSKAQLIFTPAASDQEYCTGSVIADSKGGLYYSNDSHKLFKIVGDETNAKSDDNGSADDNGKGSNGKKNASNTRKNSIANSGNNGGNPVMSVRSSVAPRGNLEDEVANAKKALGKDGADKAKSGSGAESAVGGTSAGRDSAADGGARSSAHAAVDGIPIWPIICMIIAAITLVASVVGYRRANRPSEVHREN